MTLYFGLFCFVLPYVLFLYSDLFNDFVQSCYNIAPEITTITSVIYCYLTIRSFYFGFVPNIKNKKKVYISQINMLASAMVSIGLIGTFIGLVEMISSISGVLNNQSPGEINSMTDGIGSSLNGMSFAFLTSILGVGTSAYVIFSGFFIASNMDKATNTNISDCMNPDSIYERVNEMEKKLSSLRLSNIEYDVDLLSVMVKTNDNLNSLISKKEENNKILLNINELLNSLKEEQVNNVDDIKTLSRNSNVIVEVIGEINENNSSSTKKIDSILKLSSVNNKLLKLIYQRFKIYSEYIEKFKRNIFDTFQ